MCEELGDPSPFRVKQGVGGPWTREILRGTSGTTRDKRKGARGEAGNEGDDKRRAGNGRKRQVNSLGTVRLFWGSYIHLYYLYMCSPINKVTRP